MERLSILTISKKQTTVAPNILRIVFNQFALPDSLFYFPCLDLPPAHLLLSVEQNEDALLGRFSD